MLTGKCKTDFEEWYGNEHPNGYWYALVNFYGLPISMQYGVYVDFFLSNKIDVLKFFYEFYRGTYDYTVNMSREETIKKANEIYNDIKR